MYPKIKLFLAFTLLLAYQSGKAQLDKYSINLSIRPGFIVPHHSYMNYFLTENVNAIQLNFGLATNGNKYWHSDYNYPIIGLGIHYSGLGNDSLYGNLTGLYFFINRFFLDNNRRFNIGNTLSVGVSYASKWHNLESNRANIVLSTPLNVFFQYDIGITYKLKKNHTISTSLGFAHASNGSVKEPNLGFNIFTTSLGYRYSFGQTSPPPKVQPEDKTPHSLWNFGFFASTKSIDAFTGKQYGVFGFSAENLYRLAPLSLIGLEFTAYKDNSIPQEILENDITSPLNSNDNIAIAINASYLMGFDRVSIAFQPGIYLRNQFYGFGAITNKIGLRIRVYQGLNFTVAIKAHWVAQADFIELGIKYSLTQNEK